MTYSPQFKEQTTTTAKNTKKENNKTKTNKSSKQSKTKEKKGKQDYYFMTIYRLLSYNYL